MTYYEEILDNGLMDNTDMKKLIDEIKSDYKIKDFKHICVFTNYMKIQSIIKEQGDEFIVECVEEDEDDEATNPIAGSYVSDDLAVVVKYYPFLDNRRYCFMFVDDEEKFNQFNKDVLVYKPGTYKFSDLGGMNLHEFKLTFEREPIIDKEMERQLQFDIDQFFDNKGFYNENNLAHKRGILLYGTWGTGKTTFIKSILKKQKDCYSIIMDCGKDFRSEFGTFVDRAIGDEKKIIVFEDIDKISEYNKTTLFNFLDGVNVLQNTIIMATTNNLADLDGALVSRPSRFDRLYNFDLPNPETRKEIIKLYFKEIDFDLDKAVVETDGFSGAFLKELFILTNIQKTDIFTAINNIKAQFKIIKDYDLKSSDRGNYFG